MKKYIATGLIMLLPFALTMWIIGTIINWITGPFSGITKKIVALTGLSDQSFWLLSQAQTTFIIDKLLVLLLLFLGILTIGFIGKHVIIASLLRLSDKVLHKIPVISSVYKTSQELITALFSSKNRAFKQVVLVPFPHQHCLMLGLVSREDCIDPSLVPIFIPTTPNPTSGYLVMYERTKVMPVDMSVEEAFRYIITCGTLLSKNTIKQTSMHYGTQQ